MNSIVYIRSYVILFDVKGNLLNTFILCASYLNPRRWDDDGTFTSTQFSGTFISRDAGDVGIAPALLAPANSLSSCTIPTLSFHQLSPTSSIPPYTVSILYNTACAWLVHFLLAYLSACIYMPTYVATSLPGR